MTIEEKREANRLKNTEWRKKNRQRYNQLANNWKLNNPDKIRRYKLKDRYGITPEQYVELFSNQNGRCDICKKEETARHNRSKKVQKLAVDHCHLTGKVRGLLCQDCNRGIAKFHENIDSLKKAIAYLTKHSNCDSIKT